jgi:hypothetical protein
MTELPVDVCLRIAVLDVDMQKHEVFSTTFTLKDPL